MQNHIIGTKLISVFSVSPLVKRELEALVVNNVKIKMLKKLEGFLEKEGQQNLKELLLVPIFELEEMMKRVEETAPEIRTIFYKELMNTIFEMEKDLDTPLKTVSS